MYPCRRTEVNDKSFLLARISPKTFITLGELLSLAKTGNSDRGADGWGRISLTQPLLSPFTFEMKVCAGIGPATGNNRQ